MSSTPAAFEVFGRFADTLRATMSVFVSLLLPVRSSVRSRAALQIEVLALRHQLYVPQQSRPHRVRLTRVDRLLWVWLSRAWTEWRAAIIIVKPETVIAWHQHGFRLFWTWKSRRRLRRPWRHWICRKRAD
jgi:putative transposase